MRRRPASRALLALVAAFAAFAAAACVPASDALPPAGAAGFTTEPSPASRGEPFVTSDGWTVRFESFAVQTNVSGMPERSESDPHGSFTGKFEEYLWNAGAPTRLFARALAVGPTRLELDLQQRYLEDPTQIDDETERFENLGVPEEVSARFNVPVTQGSTFSSYAAGPVVVFVARGEKDGRVVTLDLSLAAGFFFLRESESWHEVPRELVVVRANDLTLVPLPVHVERLFAVSPVAGSAIRFGPYADADAKGDGDGRASAAELQATLRTCDACPKPKTPQDAEETFDGTLLDELAGRMPLIFGEYAEGPAAQ